MKRLHIHSLVAATLHADDAHGQRPHPFQILGHERKVFREMIPPGGGIAPHNHLAASAAGLTWDSPTSGGGTWVYNVRLAGPDSMVGTLVLRDPPPSQTPAPTGTLVLTRQPAGAPRGK